MNNLKALKMSNVGELCTCSSRKYPSPPQRAFLLQTPPPPPPWNFQLGLAPPGKTISVKKAVTLYCYAKDDCSCHQEKKNLLFMLIQCLIISILPCKGLSQLMINSKALRNMEAIPYMTQMMPSVQEPVRFKLN